MTGNIAQWLNRGRWAQHLLFWGAAFYVLLLLFRTSSGFHAVDLIYTSIFMLTLAAGVYINLCLLIPFFLSKRRYLCYVLLITLCVILAAGFNQVMFSHWIDWIFPGYYFISYYSYGEILLYFFTFFSLTSLLKLSKGWFMLADAKNQVMNLQKERAETELKALKTQINPHFLFNSLNSIYSLSRKKSPDTPEVILKLSEFMRYLIYETEADMVDLHKELEYIQDYIGLQKLRSDSRATITVDITGDPGNSRVPPLLFLPLIENSFKHGIKGETGNSFVTIGIQINQNRLIFRIENNKGFADPLNNSRNSGIGLENLKKRLAMIYPNQHRLKITDSETTFMVKLQIPLSHENDLPDRGR